MFKKFNTISNYIFSLIVLASIGYFLISCGEEEASDTEDGEVIVIGAGNTFATPDITAPAGATITILNRDDNPHTVTSQTAEDAFDNTGVFDAMVPSDGTQILTLPAAASGTVFFFYDRFYEDVMSPANGSITIE